MFRFFRGLLQLSGKSDANEQTENEPDYNVSNQEATYVAEEKLHINQEIGTLIKHGEVAEVHGESVLACADNANIAASTVHRSHFHYHHPIPPVSEETIAGLVEEFKMKVKERSMVESSGEVTQSYKEQNLVEPKNEYTPQLKKIKFYQGERGSGVKGSVDTTLDKIFHLSSKKRVAIVGQAGSGKTTLMKRLARDAVAGRLEILSEHHDVLVHFLNVRDVPVSKKITLCSLLFGKVLPELSDEAIKYGFNWLREHQETAIFFFDGLDQATWSVLGRHSKIRYNDKACTSTIMCNLLEGHLFPNVLIVLSSREHTLSPLTGNMRPEPIIGLAGFSIEDRKSLFIELVGEDGERLWNLLYTRSPSLVPLCSIPLFLVFTVIVYKSSSDNTPNTMSGIMVNILLIFLQSEHTHERSNIDSILARLKQMSFEATKNGKVIFTLNDLKKFDLVLNTVCDHVVFVPGCRKLGQYLLEGLYRLFFCHSSIQEMLAALYVAEMEFEMFKVFVKESLHLSHWSVVRRFLCGVLLNRDIYKDASNDILIASDSIFVKKRSLLKQSLKDELCRNSNSSLELFSAFYESNNSKFIQSVIDKVNFSSQFITPNDMYAISSLLQQCTKIKLLKLVDCNLSSEIINILCTGLLASSVQIARLDLRENRIEKEDFTYLCAAISHCKVEELFIDKYTIQTKTSFSKQVGRLHFSGKDLGIEELSALGSVIRNCHEMDSVMMINNGFHGNEIRSFLHCLGEMKIKSLNVCWNREMGESGLTAIGDMVQLCNVEELDMRYCDLKPNEIKCFQKSLRNSLVELRTLKLGNNENLTKDGFEIVGTILKDLSEVGAIKHLDISECNLNPEEIKAFQESLGKAEISYLDLSHNKYMGVDGLRIIGEIVKECHVNHLNVSHSHLTASALEAFKDGLGNGKTLRRLSIGNNGLIDEAGIIAVGMIAKQQEIMNEINLSYCNLTSQCMESFHTVLGNTSINCLNLSYNDHLGNNDRHCFENISAIVSQCGVSELNIFGCSASERDIDMIWKESKHMLKNLIHSRIGSGGFSSFGQLSR